MLISPPLSFYLSSSPGPAGVAAELGLSAVGVDEPVLLVQDPLRPVQARRIRLALLPIKVAHLHHALVAELAHVHLKEGGREGGGELGSVMQGRTYVALEVAWKTVNRPGERKAQALNLEGLPFSNASNFADSNW